MDSHFFYIFRNVGCSLGCSRISVTLRFAIKTDEFGMLAVNFLRTKRDLQNVFLEFPEN